jgi:hypothetical protein
VQQGDAPPPASVKLRRPRRAAVAGPGGDAQRRLQELGDVLDALVRGIARRDPLADGLARRAHELWLEEQQVVLHWRPTELRAGPRLVLAASVDGGRFILPGYAAGLRALAIRPASVPADIMRLARRLAALEEGTLDGAGFAAWLWRGGALGLDAAQSVGTDELGEALIDPSVPEAELWAACSARVVGVFSDLAQKAAAALPAAALEARFRAPIERMEQRARAGELGLSIEDAQCLRSVADAPGLWAAAELKLVSQQAELRGVLPAAHLGLRLVDLIDGADAIDADLLGLCASLAAGSGLDLQGPPLDIELLGAALGRKVLQGGLRSQLLLELVERAEPALLGGVLTHLCERAREQDVAVQAMTLLSRHWGARSLFARIQIGQLESGLAIALVEAALDEGMQVPELLQQLDLMSLETVLRVLCAQPALLPPAQPMLERLIAEQPQASGPLLPALIQAGPAGARAAGTVLLGQQGAGLAVPVLRPALIALVRSGHGVAFVLPLWEARGNASSVRLAALGALEADADLVAQAVRGRKVAMLEPPEIREALEELRWR